GRTDRDDRGASVLGHLTSADRARFRRRPGRGTPNQDPERRDDSMLENTKAFSGFAVDDLERAQRFYGATLGLRTSEDNGLLILHLAGGRNTLVYPKPDHTPATYTIINFPLDDTTAAVDSLGGRGGRVEG